MKSKIDEVCEWIEGNFRLIPYLLGCVIGIALYQLISWVMG